MAQTPNPNLGFGFAPRPARDPLVGTVIAGRFRLEELIGQGGMGKVYRARHLELDRIVCLKMLKAALLEDPTVVGRFKREAMAASRLNHPNGIQVLDFGKNEADGSLFIVMEYVQGKDLRLILRDEWPIEEGRLCSIIAQVLAALGEAHAHNVIHRDLKPENIMVEQRPDQPELVKVLDFGIAKILDPDTPGLTRSDVVCGTPQYMAPEQATGAQLDARCDLYAVGVILYQMATGLLPFDGPNSMEVLTQHVNEPPVPPRKRQPGAPISGALEALILRALEKDPAARPQSAAEFRKLLLDVPGRRAAAPAEPAGEQQALPAEPSAPPPPPLARAGPAGSAGSDATLRRPLFAAVAAGAVALALLLAGYAALSLRKPAAGTAISLSGPDALSQRDAAQARSLVRQASEWQANHDPAAARGLLERALALDPDNSEAHYRLGALLLASQPGRAKAELAAAKLLDPQKYTDAVDRALQQLEQR